MDFWEKTREIIKSFLENIHEWRKLVLTLSCLVVFITTYMLILPAFTLDKEEASEQGGIDVPTVEQSADTDETAEDLEKPSSEDSEKEEATEASSEDVEKEESAKPASEKPANLPKQRNQSQIQFCFVAINIAAYYTYARKRFVDTSLDPCHVE